jgi:hypothetical protein
VSRAGGGTAGTWNGPWTPPEAAALGGTLKLIVDFGDEQLKIA